MKRGRNGENFKRKKKRKKEMKTQQTPCVFIDWTVMERVKSLTLTIYESDRVRDEGSKILARLFCPIWPPYLTAQPELHPTRLSLTSDDITSKTERKVYRPSLRMLNHLTNMSTRIFLSSFRVLRTCLLARGTNKDIDLPFVRYISSLTVNKTRRNGKRERQRHVDGSILLFVHLIGWRK